MWLVALLLGVVEGLTEFLPVSSTGHLILTSAWLDSHGLGFEGRRAELFEIFIQLGAILSVVVEYRGRFTSLARDALRKDDARAFVFRLGLAFVPATYHVIERARERRGERAPVPHAVPMAGGR